MLRSIHRSIVNSKELTIQSLMIRTLQSTLMLKKLKINFMTSSKLIKWATIISNFSHQTTETFTIVQVKVLALHSWMRKFPKRVQSTTKIINTLSRSCKWCRTGVRTMELRTWFLRAQGTHSWRIIRSCIKALTTGLMPRTSRILCRKFRWDLASTRRTVQLRSPRVPPTTWWSYNCRWTRMFTPLTSWSRMIARACSRVPTRLLTISQLTWENTTPWIWITRSSQKGSQPMPKLTNGPYLNMISEYNNSP